MIKYKSIKTILANISRKIKDFNEIDAIEDAVLALKMVYIPDAMQEKVTILQVKNYHADIPSKLKRIIQLVKDTRYNEISQSYCPIDTTEDSSEIPEEFVSLCDNLQDETFIPALENAILMDFSTFYAFYRSKSYFQPIRLSDAKFFGSEVYEEYNKHINSPYEYTIIEGKKFRFNFKEGYVFLAYDEIPVDEEGIPLVPDNPSVIKAITYYVMWQIAERNMWAGRQGFGDLVKYSEQHWLKYVAQAKSALKMPKNIDELKNLRDSATHIIPPDNYNTLR